MPRPAFTAVPGQHLVVALGWLGAFALSSFLSPASGQTPAAADGAAPADSETARWREADAALRTSPASQACKVSFEYDSAGIDEAVTLSVHFVIMRPVSCVAGQQITLEHMPIGETRHPGDYRLSRTTIEINDSDGSEGFGIHIVDDAIHESAERFKIFFGDLPPGVTAARPDTLYVTINDNDHPRPGIPRNLTAMPGDGEVTLRWEAPTTGAEPDRYEYQYRDGSGRVTAYETVDGGSAARSVEVTGLRNGTAYTFNVRAVTGPEWGPVASVTATPNSAPGTPRSLMAEAGDAQVTLRWDAPAAGGDPTSYAYRYQAGSQAFSNWATVPGAGAARTLTVTSLANRVLHTFEVRARNGTGPGPAAAVTATPVPATVSTLSITNAVVTEGAGTAELAVKLRPASTRAVTVDYATQDGTATLAGQDYVAARGTLTFAAGDTSMVIAIAINDDSEDEDNETLTVTLRNASADAVIGVATAAITIEDDDNPPDPPRQLQAEAGDGTVTLYWLPPDDDGGTRVTGYQYRYAVGLSPFWTDGWETVPGGSQARAVTVTGLTNDTEYSFQVRVGNRVGFGGPAAVTAIPLASPSVRVEPRRLVLTEGTAADYTVALGARPHAAVTIRMITDLVDTDLTVTPVQIEFTQSNWNTPRAITVKSTVDADSEDEAPVELVHVASGGSYEGTDVPSVIVEVLDNTQPSITGRDARGEEGMVLELVFAVSLSPASTNEVTVSYETGDGSAVAGEDYVATSGTLTLPAGTTRGTIAVPLLDDTVEEDTETFRLELFNAVNATLDAPGGRLPLTGTIIDSDVTEVSVSFARTGYTVLEGNRVQVGVTVTDQVEEATAIAIRASPGAGARDSDFSVPDSVYLRPGSTGQVLEFEAWPDDLDEDDEVVELELGPNLPAGFVRGGAVRTRVTIADDDTRGVEVSTDALTVTEGSADSYTVRLTSQPTAPVTVAVATDLSETDVTVNPSMLRFTPDDWSAARTIVVAAGSDPDAAPDPDVVLNHRATGGDYTGMAVQSVTVTIVEVDRTTMSVTDAVATEAEGEIVFVVTVDHPGGQLASARYATVDGTAREGMDYLGAAGTVVVPPGRERAEIVVSVLDDMLDEEVETFSLRLSNFVNANEGIAFVSVEGTILDDDLPTVSVTALEQSIVEGDLARFRLKRTGVLGTTLTVPIEVGKTGDFLAGRVPASVTFAAGDREAVLDLPTVDDNLDEPDGRIAVTVAGSDEYAIEGPSTVEVPVVDNDAAPTILITDNRVRESAGAVDFQVALAGTSTRMVRVDWTTADGTARAGEDYRAASGTLVFAPDQTLAAVRIAVLDDLAPEGDETFTVTLSSPRNATMQAAVATATITDDDDAVAAAYMSRFGRTVASQVVEGLTGRLDGADMRWSMDGVTGPAQSFLRQQRGSSLPQLLNGASFRLSRDVDQLGDGVSGGTLTAWASAAYSRFEGSEESASVDGGVLTGLAGVDYEFGNVLAGVAVSHSLGDGSFDSVRPGPLSTVVESSLSNVYPYLRVHINDRFSAWGIGGIGGGDMGFRGLSSDDGIHMTMAAVGGRSNLLDRSESGTGLALAAKTDVLFVQMTSDGRQGVGLTDANANRARLLVEARTTGRVGTSATLGSRLEFGVRHDGGDAETGLGLEVAGGASYINRARGLSFEATVRRMVTHQDGTFGEWGLGGTVAYQPLGPSEGLSLRLGSAWGVPQSGVQALWSPYSTRSPSMDRRRDGARGTDARQVDAQVGYAFKPFGEDVAVAPYAEYSTGGGTLGNSPRVGWRVSALESFRLALEYDLPGFGRREQERHGVTLRGSFSR